jgi:cytochrome c oxidase subunit I
MGWDFLNLVETIGAFVIALSALVFIANVVISRARNEAGGADPWDGRTLEWSTSSPPPEYNFAEVPLVKSRDDFWHRKYVETPAGEPARVFAGGATHEAAANHETEAHDEHGEAAGHDHHIHMPSPSYFPALASVGLPLMGYGVIFEGLRSLIIVGALIVVLSLFGWVLEPAAEGDPV